MPYCRGLRLLIKFGYPGWEFTGYQTGNGKRSVEDTILEVMKRRGLSESLHSAARTDRGVSAVSNAFAVDTTERPSKVLGILNSSIDTMIFHSVASVPDDFNPRHCDYKIYQYLVRKDEVGPYFRESLKPFRGRHDFRNFCKMDERNPVRTIRSLRITKRSGMIYVDFKARSFLWNQIRTIMAYARDHSFSPSADDPFSITGRYPAIMDPEPLLLLDMVYPDVDFRPALSTSKKRSYREILDRFNLRNHVMGSFSGIM